MTSILEQRLCPWLHPALDRLEQARVSGRLGHGWLVAGPAGVGKLNLVLCVARRLLEREAAAPEPLDAAAASRALAERRAPMDHHPDLHRLHPDEDRRTIGIERVRDLIEALTLKSLRGGAKVAIIEPAEAMTVPAANALLKTLEEPTADTYLWLVSHEPGRLPATIRSRCQVLTVPSPSAEEAAAWLAPQVSLDAAETRRLLAIAGGGPLRLLDLMRSDFLRVDKELTDNLIEISRNRVDPQTVAEQCLKMDVSAALAWLAGRLRFAIRARLAPGASNPVTDSQSDALHNAWQVLTLDALFAQLRATETLLQQLGGGINVELAMRVLMLGFRPERG